MDSSTATSSIGFGPWIAHPSRNRLERDGRTVKIEPRAMDVLVCLAERAGGVVSVDELIATVWQGTIVGEGSVYLAIRQLRRALEDSSATQYIENIPRRGYRLTVPVRRIDPESLATRSDEVTSAADVLSTELTAGRRRPPSGRGIRTLAAVAALAVIGIGWTVADRSNDRSPIPTVARTQEMAPAVIRFSIGVPASIRERLNRAPQSVLALSPDGRRIVFYAGMLMLRSLDTLTLQAIPGTEDAHQPFFSPDGRWVGYFTRHGELKKVRVDGSSPPVTIVRGTRDASARFGLWREDDTIVYSSGDRSLSVVSANGGRPARVELEGRSGERIGGPIAALGTRLLLTYGYGPKGTRIELYDGHSHERVAVLENAWLAASTASGHLLFVRDGLLMAAPFDAESLGVGPVATVPLSIERDDVGVIRQFAVSPNGTLVYLAAQGGDSQVAELGWMHRNGEFTPLTMLPPLGEPRTLAVSHDFGAVLTTGARDLEVVTFLFDSASRELTTLQTGIRSATWHADGRQIALSGRQGLKIWDAVNAAETMLDEDIKDAHSVRFAPDGASLVYSAPRPDDNIYAYDIEARTESAIVASPAREILPALSPDGSLIAYVSYDGGVPVVQVTAFPDGDVSWNAGPGSFAPVWSADGTELFFSMNNTATGSMEMRSVTVSMEEALTFSASHTVFSVPNEDADEYRFSWGNTESPMFGVSPDGARFLMMRFPPEQTEQSANLIVVQNWHEELNKLAPADQAD